jgi:hypothetical protein
MSPARDVGAFLLMINTDCRSGRFEKWHLFVVDGYASAFEETARYPGSSASEWEADAREISVRPALSASEARSSAHEELSPSLGG